MTSQLILASGSSIRQNMLLDAGVEFTAITARVDEDAIKQSLQSEGALPRDIADALAELKAARVSAKHPQAMVLGCDQVLEADGQIISKPETPDDARAQLAALNGKRHALLSAAVLFDGGEPVWRHVGMARLHMRQCSDAYLDDYVDRNWESIRHSVGAYKIEEEGVRLFHRIEGDFFTILGLPLLELLSYLTLRGVIPG